MRIDFALGVLSRTFRSQSESVGIRDHKLLIPNLLAVSAFADYIRSRDSPSGLLQTAKAVEIKDDDEDEEDEEEEKAENVIVGAASTTTGDPVHSKSTSSQQILTAFSDITELLERWPGIQSFKWTGDAMNHRASTYKKGSRLGAFWSALSKTAPTLKHLDLGFYVHELSDMVGDGSITNFPTAFPKLESLHVDISGGHGDPADAVNSLLLNTPSLVSLTLDLPTCDLETCRATGLKYNWNFPALKTLSLSVFWDDASEVADFLSRHPTVTNLYFSAEGEEPLPDVDRLLPNLRTLSIGYNCSSLLTDLSSSTVSRPIVQLRLHQPWDVRKLDCIVDLSKTLTCLEIYLDVLGMRGSNDDDDEEEDEEDDEESEANGAVEDDQGSPEKPEGRKADSSKERPTTDEKDEVREIKIDTPKANEIDSNQFKDDSEDSEDSPTIPVPRPNLPTTISNLLSSLPCLTELSIIYATSNISIYNNGVRTQPDPMNLEDLLQILPLLHQTTTSNLIALRLSDSDDGEGQNLPSDFLSNIPSEIIPPNLKYLEWNMEAHTTLYEISRIDGKTIATERQPLRKKVASSEETDWTDESILDHLG